MVAAPATVVGGAATCYTLRMMALSPSSAGLRRRHVLCLALSGAVMPRLARAAAVDPAAPIASLYAALEALMRLGAATPFRDRYHRIAPVIDRTFELPTILRASIGTQWATLDPAAQAALHAAFRRFTIASYVASFDKYEGEQFELIPSSRQVGADQVVQSRIIQDNGEPVRLDYVMRQTAAGWRAVDVLLDGTISRVAVQHSDFRALLHNGDASALIASLRQKAADLAGHGQLDS
jgi:phospholipid transport system substrate-binding protein